MVLPVKHRCFIAIMALCISLSLTPVAWAQEGYVDEEGPTAARASFLDNPCWIPNTTWLAPLTLTFTTPMGPCAYTQWNPLFMPGLTFTLKPGGGAFTDYLEGWWRNEYLPALQKMTSQTILANNSQLTQKATFYDAQATIDQEKAFQKQAYETAKEIAPNELVCTGTSMIAPLNQSTQLAAALPEAFNDLRENGQPSTPPAGGTGSAGSGAGSPTTAAPVERPTIASDQKNNFEEYCKYFYDPKTNNGVTGCPDKDTIGTIPDGDIDVEGILFKDTIDFRNEDQRTAAEALVRNLVKPTITERIPDELVNNSLGQEWIVKKNQIDAARDIARNVISGIVSTRAGSPPDVGPLTPPTASASADLNEPPPADPTPPGPTPPPPPKPKAGSYEDYLLALRTQESSNCRVMISPNTKFIGCYQFGYQALRDVRYIKDTVTNNEQLNDPSVWVGVDDAGRPIRSMQDFLAMNLPGRPRGAMEDAMRKLDAIKWNRYLIAPLATNVRSQAIEPRRVVNTKNYLGHTIGGVLLTPSGLLAGAHLVGSGPVAGFIATNGQMVERDANNTSVVKYMTKFGGYDIPFPDAGTFPRTADDYPRTDPKPGQPQPPIQQPPKTTGELVKEIRLRAGVPEANISDGPSYNEIMLSLTKERYFDPEYFLRAQSNPDNIKQEQAAVSAYTSAQYEEIYTLREKINALISAKAALQLANQRKPTATESTPVSNSP